MHLTLKREATRPAGMNSLQRQARFDAFLDEEQSVTHLSGPDSWNVGDPGRTRTCDLQLRRLLLYPLSYGAVSAVQGWGRLNRKLSE